MNRRSDFLSLTSKPHFFLFHLQKNFPKNPYELPVVTSKAFAQFAGWFYDAVQRQDAHYQGRIVIQHPGCRIQRIDNVLSGLETIAQVPHTTPRLRVDMMHDKDADSWLALEREGITSYRMSFFGQGLDEKLVRAIQGQFEKNRRCYTVKI